MSTTDTPDAAAAAETPVDPQFPATASPQHTKETDTLWTATPSQLVNLGYWTMAGLVFAAGVVAYGQVSPHLQAQGLPPAAAYGVSHALMGWSVAYALWRYLVVRLHRYWLTNVRLKLATGVLVRRHHQLELFRVKDIGVQRPLYLLVFGLGNLSLATSDRTHPIFPIRAVGNPTDLADRLRELVQEARRREGVREID